MSATQRIRPRKEVRKDEGPRPMHISLRAGERLFLNGAVVRVDRKVTLELLNDATFLLENHVLQVEDTTTPLRQLYFAVQAMLMDPSNAAASRALFEGMARDVMRVVPVPGLLAGIAEAQAQVAANRPFHALKTLRSLYDEEAAFLSQTEARLAAKRAAEAGPAAEPTKLPAPLVRQRPAANAPDHDTTLDPIPEGSA